MTFKALIDHGYVFPSIIDEATQQLVTDWFYDRKIATEDDGDESIAKWKRFFERQLLQKYPYYQQLLRIDSTNSEYDWLIQNYNESQKNSINSVSFTNTTNESDTTSNESTTNTEGVRTHNDSTTNEHESATTNKNKNQTTNTGDTITQNDSAQAGRAYVQGRTNPMSASYDTAEMAGDTVDLIVGTDAAYELEITSEEYGAGIALPNISNPTTSTDNVNRQHTVSVNKDTLNTVTIATDDGTISGSGKSTTASSGQDGNNSTVTATAAGNTNKEKTDINKGSTNELERAIDSGRTTAIAILLAGAKDFIMSTNAWVYLYKELDKCFMVCYD